MIAFGLVSNLIVIVMRKCEVKEVSELDEEGEDSDEGLQKNNSANIVIESELASPLRNHENEQEFDGARTDSLG